MKRQVFDERNNNIKVENNNSESKRAKPVKRKPSESKAEQLIGTEHKVKKEESKIEQSATVLDNKEYSAEENQLTPTLILVETGDIILRSDANTKKRTRVVKFLLGKTEVSVQDYYSVADSKTINKDTCKLCPITNVTWLMAIEYCNKLSLSKKLAQFYVVKNDTVRINPKANGYRLPTIVEWEFASSGGKTNAFKYAGSNKPHDVGWFAQSGKVRVQQIALKKPNSLGFYDMSGNVAEWCMDINLPSDSTYILTAKHFAVLGGSIESQLALLPDIRRNVSSLKSIGFRICQSK